MTAADDMLYGNNVMDEDAVTFNHAEKVRDAEDEAAITAVTVYTSKVSLPEGEEEELIVDVALEYQVGGRQMQIGPSHPAAGKALSSTFGLPGDNRITEVVGAFSPRGLTFICFKTNKRTHIFGKAVPSHCGGSSFTIKVPADKRLMGLRGQVGCPMPKQEALAAAIQSLAPVFANLPYLDNANVSAVTMHKKDEPKKEKAVRKLTRMSGRSTNSSLVSSVGSQQSAPDSTKRPETQRGLHSQQPAGKSIKKNGFVTVSRTWNHPLGTAIEGEFVGDSLNGRATFTWSNGDRYVGQVQDGIAHGWGVFTVAKSGDTYNGSFEGGDMRGWGTMRFGNGDQYEGAFDKGQAYGQGHMIASNGDRYVGSFVDGHACGQGIKVWNDGRKYTGEWKKAREHGTGRMAWADGSWCEGAWNKGQMHGQGVLINSDGDKYKGGWRWHKLHGAGTWTFASGVVFHGRWENGTIVAKGELSNMPPPGSTLSQPALARHKDTIEDARGIRAVLHDSHEDLEDLDAIISSGRAPVKQVSRHVARVGAGSVGGLKVSPGTTAVAVPSGMRIMPYGGPNAEDLEGIGTSSCSAHLLCTQQQRPRFYMHRFLHHLQPTSFGMPNHRVKNLPHCVVSQRSNLEEKGLFLRIFSSGCFVL